MTHEPLFIFGTARSGSTLLAKMLDAHPSVAVASDPFFMLFRLFRNAAAGQDPRIPAGAFNPQAPLQDYYFQSGQLAVMQAMLEANLDLPCDAGLWDASFEQRLARLNHECPDLAPLLPQMQGASFRQLLGSGLGLIAQGRNKPGAAYAGIKEVWLIEHVLPLLRAWPKAKFVIISRDPRAVVNSMLTMPDPSARAHVGSYLRHWRKFAAFLSYYQDLGLFQESLFHLRFEDLVRDPQGHSRDLCRFLGTAYDPAMVDPERHLDYSTGAAWQGNASSGGPTAGVCAALAESWRGALDDGTTALCDFLLGPDMRLLGYEPVYTFASPSASPSASAPGSQPGFAEVYACAARDNARTHNWRTDSGDLAQDFAFELFRKALLEPGAEAIEAADEQAVRRAFLFPQAWRALRHQQLIPCNRNNSVAQ